MTQESLVVRCPICGNGLSIAMAVGQMLRCPHCQTTFLAPLEEPAEGPAAGSASVDASQPSVEPTVGLPTARPVVDDLLPPGVSSHQQTASLDSLPPLAVGDDVPVAGGAFGAAPIGVAPAAVDEAARLTYETDDDIADTDEYAPTWSPWLSRAAALLVLVLVGSGLGAVAVIVWRDRSQPEPVTSRPNAVAAPDEVDWRDATKPLRLGRVDVRIESVAYDELVARDVNNEIVRSEGERFVKISLSIRNRNTQTVLYSSWYGNVFPIGNDVTVAALLLDDQGRSYQMMTFEDVTAVQGHVKEAAIEPGRQVEDLIVFEAPADVDVAQVQWLRLELPGEAFGHQGVFRFQIPRTLLAWQQSTAEAP